MSIQGDDCYFFYYSTCTKGDSCPFRHCEAAMGNETVCNLWQEGRCFRTVCKFRHMEITKNRKEISCYWENQAAGCQKQHCAFFHEKPRYIDGVFVPPDKNPSKNVEQLHEEPSAAIAANPQLRCVVKPEAMEPVPSPTHPPVVINPADDDEDEDEEGEVSHSPRKLPRSDDSPNFGVCTLEEIRLRKALMASMKRACYPFQNADTSANREKENIQSFFQAGLHKAGEDFEETRRPRGSVTKRFGRNRPNTDVTFEELPLKRSLAERLGGVVDEEAPPISPQKALKAVKERLGLSTGSAAAQPAAETSMVSKNSPDQIRIKTLEEIRLEKAAKSQSLSKDGSLDAPEINTKPSKDVKQDQPISHLQTFSESRPAKRKWQKEQAKNSVEKAPVKSHWESNSAGPDLEPLNLGGIRVKTLEEIRREKSARTKVQQVLEAENKDSSDTEENATKKLCFRRIKKPNFQHNITAEKSAEVTEKPLRAHAATSETDVADSNGVRVKTFEEIMREKRHRKQEMEEHAKSLAEAGSCQKQTADGTLKRHIAPKVSLTLPATSSTQKVPVRKLIPLKSEAASPPNNSTAAKGCSAVTSVQVKPGSSPQPHSQASSSSKESPVKSTRTSGSTLSPAKRARAATQGPSTTLKELTTDTKVRPKLNVKPSVMKPAAQLKPGNKRRGTARSAVAAIKPLSSASTVMEEPLQETACGEREVHPSFRTEAQQSSDVPCRPSTSLVSSSSPVREELQTGPVFKQSQETKPTVSVAVTREPCTVPLSPVLKSPAQPKSRRVSGAASRTAPTSSITAPSTSAVDDFEELMNEFTDDHLMHEDVDPDIGEDDLLQELSEMIDS